MRHVDLGQASSGGCPAIVAPPKRSAYYVGLYTGHGGSCPVRLGNAVVTQIDTLSLKRNPFFAFTPYTPANPIQEHVMQQSSQPPLFRLDGPYRTPVKKALFSIAAKPLTKILRFDTLNSLYAQYQREDSEGEFVDRVLEMFGIRLELGGRPVERLPRSGPLMVVANHPFGAVEGVILVKLLRHLRPDVKVMANSMLGRIPEMKEHLIEVDPFGGSGSVKANVSGLKQSLRWLKAGHLLAVFPAGEVSSLKVGKRMVADPPWSETVARMVRKVGCPVAPMFFNGRNSAVFQAAGMIHPRLRTVLLPHENLKRARRTVQVSIGGAIDYSRLAAFETDRELTDYLRFRTYVLRRQRPSLLGRHEKTHQKPISIANTIPRHILASEVAALPDANTLIRSGDMCVFQAEAWRIPRVLREVGVLREKTFRAVGEGTGHPMDIDRFDDTYRHLVLWNERKREVCGAYRFALCDEILAEQGRNSLYSASLFRFDKGLLESLQPALELGRSFIREEYQRSYQPLLMLWKGLAAFIVRNPRYSKLFGCVSISGDYSTVSRELMVRFLKRHCFDASLGTRVTPSTPLKNKALRKLDFSLSDSVFNDPEDIGGLVTDVEDGRGIPVLLKQYLKLGGRLLGFNVDPDFGDCLDGLILVDLVNTEEKILGRFMGREGAGTFLEHHRKPLHVLPAA